MRLWAGHSTHFVRDTTHNQIAEKLRTAFFHHYRYDPPPSEVNAWRNSLRAVATVFQEAALDDHGVMLEYRLPLSSKRLDCLVCGHDEGGTQRASIIELKQWDRCSEAVGDKLVTTFVGGAERDVLHPSAQVGGYQQYLEDTHTAFYDGDDPIRLGACAYLHNYLPHDEDVLFAAPFRPLLERYPVFTADDVERLARHLGDQLGGGEGLDVLKRIEQSKYPPSKKLMEHVAATIGKPQWVLLDEQLVVFEKVLAPARAGFHDRRKTVLIVKGARGQGSRWSRSISWGGFWRKATNAQYATGSRAFTETLREIVSTRGTPQFRYFNSYREADAGEIDVLICDESHRIPERHSAALRQPR